MSARALNRTRDNGWRGTRRPWRDKICSSCLKCVKTAVFPGFFLFPKRLKRCEVSDRFLGCGPSSFLQSALSAAGGGCVHPSIQPAAGAAAAVEHVLGSCTGQERDASHQHSCLRARIPERAFHTPEVRLQVSVLWHLSPLRPNAKFRSPKLAFLLKKMYLLDLRRNLLAPV